MHIQRVKTKEVNTVPTAGIYRTGQCTSTGTPVFRTRKIIGLIGCVPVVSAKTSRTGAIRLFQPINENNENPGEKNEKQGYPFENPDEIMRKMKNKATYSKTQMRKMKNKVKSCEAQLCCVERVKTKDFGKETNEDENVYCRLYTEVDLITNGADWFKGFKGASTPFDLFFVKCVWLHEQLGAVCPELIILKSLTHNP